jgi:hypothetical protein
LATSKRAVGRIAETKTQINADSNKRLCPAQNKNLRRLKNFLVENFRTGEGKFLILTACLSRSGAHHRRYRSAERISRVARDGKLYRLRRHFVIVRQLVYRFAESEAFRNFLNRVMPQIAPTMKTRSL